MRYGEVGMDHIVRIPSLPPLMSVSPSGDDEGGELLLRTIGLLRWALTEKTASARAPQECHHVTEHVVEGHHVHRPPHPPLALRRGRQSPRCLLQREPQFSSPSGNSHRRHPAFQVVEGLDLADGRPWRGRTRMVPSLAPDTTTSRSWTCRADHGAWPQRTWSADAVAAWCPHVGRTGTLRPLSPRFR